MNGIIITIGIIIFAYFTIKELHKYWYKHIYLKNWNNELTDYINRRKK